MNTEEIEKLLKANVITRKCFRGVFPSDKIPKKRTINFQGVEMNSFVFNLDPSYKGGSHWVALVLKKNGKSIYFDSYGLPAQLQKIKDLIGNDDCTYNKQQLQYPLTTVCGQWCIFFLLYASAYIPMQEMYTIFSSKKTLINDHKVNFYINKLFKTKHKVIEKKFLKAQMCRSLKENQK